MLTDLTAEVFQTLRTEFFDANGEPKEFSVRVKLGTQDDPIDEYIAKILQDKLPADISVAKAPGPLTSPDMVIFRPTLCNSSTQSEIEDNTTKIFGMEVKKLERPYGSKKAVGRASGMDYNSTPPCGKIKVFDRNGLELNIRGFYLFVAMEKALEVAIKQVEENRIVVRLSALVLCDGDILNEDFSYYSDIVGQRTKSIKLGTYGDGINRNRPMIIFGNPLGVPLLDHTATLVHKRSDLQRDEAKLLQVGTLARTRVDTNERSLFSCYRASEDVTEGFKNFSEVDPFKAAISREQTQGRGKFKINQISLSV